VEDTGDLGEVPGEHDGPADLFGGNREGGGDRFQHESGERALA
jgi:hypothetical protein